MKFFSFNTLACRTIHTLLLHYIFLNFMVFLLLFYHYFFPIFISDAYQYSKDSQIIFFLLSWNTRTWQYSRIVRNIPCRDLLNCSSHTITHYLLLCSYYCTTCNIATETGTRHGFCLLCKIKALLLVLERCLGELPGPHPQAISNHQSKRYTAAGAWKTSWWAVCVTPLKQYRITIQSYVGVCTIF